MANVTGELPEFSAFPASAVLERNAISENHVFSRDSRVLSAFGHKNRHKNQVAKTPRWLPGRFVLPLTEVPKVASESQSKKKSSAEIPAPPAALSGAVVVGRAITSPLSRPVAGLPSTSRVVFVGRCLARSAVRAFLNGIVAADAKVWS